MTTKRAKKVVVYLAALLVIFTLITTCLLGNTFAKYVSGTTGDAYSNISYWSVSAGGSLNSSTSTKFSSDNGLTPAESGISPTGNQYYNATAVTQIATITIPTTTEVDVSVYLSATDLSYYDTQNTPAVFTSWGDDIVNYDTPNKSQVDAALTLHVLWVKGVSSGNNSSAPTITLNNGAYSSGVTGTNGTDYGEITIGSTAGYQQIGSEWNTNGGSETYYYIYCWVTWTTDYNAYSSYGTSGKNADGIYYADKLDTWIAGNISFVQTTVSVMAIQSSTNN